MNITPRTNPVEQEALKKALEANFEIPNIDIDQLQPQDTDLDWRDEEEDLWAYRKSFD